MQNYVILNLSKDLGKGDPRESDFAAFPGCNRIHCRVPLSLILSHGGERVPARRAGVKFCRCLKVGRGELPFGMAQLVRKGPLSLGGDLCKTSRHSRVRGNPEERQCNRFGDASQTGVRPIRDLIGVSIPLT